MGMAWHVMALSNNYLGTLPIAHLLLFITHKATTTTNISSFFERHMRGYDTPLAIYIYLVNGQRGASERTAHRWAVELWSKYDEDERQEEKTERIVDTVASWWR